MSRIEISKIYGLELLDSRGNPTVEATVELSSGIFASAIAPSGASTGQYEAYELRDGGSRYCGKGVTKAVENINKNIASSLIGLNPFKQREIDSIMCKIDDTENKSKLGANAILAVSLAVARASAKQLSTPLYKYLGGSLANSLPVPMLNIINGGMHADNGLDIQEFMIMPIGAKTFSEAMQMGTEVFHRLKSILKSKGFSTNVGDEGGFAPNLNTAESALDMIMEAILQSNFSIGKDIVINLDVAASELYKNYKYHFKGSNKTMTSEQLIDWYAKLIKQYPIFSIEDPLSENDRDGFIEMTKKIGNQVQIVGDDLFVTNPIIFAKGIIDNMANSILIKPNQIGTISETFDTINLANEHNYEFIISHRSGESEENIIADIAVATGASQIKTGAPSRADRTSKYNQLLRIEHNLGNSAIFSGKRLFNKFKKYEENRK